MAETDRLNVLLLADVFEVRGSSNYTLLLARHLESYGWNPTIVCPSAGRIPQEKREGLCILEFPRFTYPLWGRFVLESLVRTLDDSPPDLIHIQSRSVLTHGTWLARKLERPFVVSVHDCLQPGEAFRFDARWGRRIIAVSEAVSTALLNQAPLQSDWISVIRSGIETNVEVPSLPVLDPGHIPVVGTACPLESVKGIPFLLGAAQRVLAEHPQVEFLISGAGPEETNLRRMARELGIDGHVTFVPNLLDFAEPLAAMDIFCLPSLQQGLGTIMLQAMGMGKPVIASNVGGVHDVVRNDENALVVRPADAQHLAERILELLNDPVRARTIAAAGRKTVCHNFSAERMVQQTAELYRAVLAVLLAS